MANLSDTSSTPFPHQREKHHSSHNYIGRFAPSPTGDLHFGSLVGALASFLDARSQKGKWLVRIEDIDPPREVAGSASSILQTLDAHHLHWDDSVFYQSHRHDDYRELLNYLSEQQLTYPCVCSRKTIAETGAIYSGLCRDKRIDSELPHAIRLKVNELPHAFQSVSNHISFEDIFRGEQNDLLTQSTGDYVVFRKDGFFAYQLVVVADDIEQGITHIIRGSDLLASTAQQIFLWQLLGQTPPQFGHFPVALGDSGEKLSKKDSAQALNVDKPSLNIFRALQFLQQNPPHELTKESPSTVISWAIDHWNRDTIPKVYGLPTPSL